MEDLVSVKLQPEAHLLLEQSLLRVPYEISRKNFKSLQRSFERERDAALTGIKTVASNAGTGQAPETTMASLDAIISRMQGLKRKMEAIQDHEIELAQQSRRRIDHLAELFTIPSLADVKYDAWSRVRLDRLLVDYLLRMGYESSARNLARERHLEALVDLDTFSQCHAIVESLKRESIVEAMSWWNENKSLIKKANTKLEYELRLQEYIELRRAGKLLEARLHARKHLASHVSSSPIEVFHATGLLAYPPTTRVEPYKTMYAAARWEYLADLFVRTHHTLFSLPHAPLLHTALSTGLSALKTPSCHSTIPSSSAGAPSALTSICPICSTELNELARPLPYAQHSKSFVEEDTVVLPNARIYGRQRLLALSSKSLLDRGHIRDPTTGDEFDLRDARRVYFP